MRIFAFSINFFVFLMVYFFLVEFWDFLLIFLCGKNCGDEEQNISVIFTEIGESFEIIRNLHLERGFLLSTPAYVNCTSFPFLCVVLIGYDG